MRKVIDDIPFEQRLIAPDPAVVSPMPAMPPSRWKPSPVIWPWQIDAKGAWRWVEDGEGDFGWLPDALGELRFLAKTCPRRLLATSRS